MDVRSLQKADSNRFALASAETDAHGLDQWRHCVALQQPQWPNAQEYRNAVEHLYVQPPLVFAGEVDSLREQLGHAAAGESFALQGGDCAETFEDSTADRISSRIRTLLQMAVVLTYGASLPVVKIGRMAGQFTKPRSSDTETRGALTLPAYRGDMVNSFEFTAQARQPDPARMVQAYHTSAATLNLIRAFTQGGFADLRHVHVWNRGFTANPAHARYEQLATQIERAVKFMEACGSDFSALERTDLFASHEALLLEYERALIRIDSRTTAPYATSGHFLWIGERTRAIDGAHVNLLAHVRNPLGVKLGPNATSADVRALLERLDPQREPGRLSFITRMGHQKLETVLPPLIEAAKAVGAQPLWICDPMHGNTVMSPNGYKTRHFDDIMGEVRAFFSVHAQMGTIPGGLHVEMSGEDVAECIGGADPVSYELFESQYATLCDPRLNHRQALELAFLVAEILAGRSST